MEKINVALGERSYPVEIERGILDRTGERVAQTLGKCACAIVTDDNVAPLYLRRVEESLDRAGIRHASVTLPHGEQTKCLARLSELYTFLCDSGVTRTDAVIALGGGVIGDLAGLAAATFLRGVRLVQIPTTLLAQVDSSVGGKVAVDLPQGKNLVGAFHQPSLVLADPDTLSTLTDAFWRDGMGEVLKYGCIGDTALLSLLEQAAPGGRAPLEGRAEEIIRRCVEAKARVVARDERDTGLRMTLNFGHTLGHAVEAAQHFSGLSHGQAVAVGMAAITRLSERAGLTQPGTLARLVALEDALSLPSRLPEIPEEQLLAPLSLDKKNLDGGLTVVLLREMGECFLKRTDASFFRGMIREGENRGANM